MIYEVERVKGIEPSSQPWEGHILPLNHTRVPLNSTLRADLTAKLRLGSRTFPNHVGFITNRQTSHSRQSLAGKLEAAYVNGVCPLLNENVPRLFSSKVARHVPLLFREDGE